VLVVGGGTAGVVAALAAARNGAKTILVERYGHLGGTMINGAGPWHSYFNTYKAFPGVKKLQLVRGIAQELVDRLVAAGGSPGHLEQDKGYAYDSMATLVDREVFKSVAFDLMQESGVSVILHALMADTVMDGGSIRGIVIESKSGREAILAGVVVDTTGDGDVAWRAGVPCINTYPDAAVGLPFGMSNVNIKKAVDFFTEKDMLTQMVYADKGSETDRFVRIGFDLRKIDVFKTYMDTAGLWGPLTVALHENDFNFINCTNIKPLDAVDVEELTRAEITLRKQVMTLAAMLKKHIPGFEKGFVSWTPRQVGVRRTRIVACEYDLSVTDIVNATQFEDEVALYGFHDCAPRILIKNGGAYGIPYRALLPKKVENLLVAGRMITSDWEAHMSTRNTVSCMAQGEAAGTAAALCARQNRSPRQLDTAMLRETLRNNGVYLDR
jgi:hypothetical protein